MEETVKQEQQIPVGISGKPDTYPQINWRDFFNLKQTVSQILDFLIVIEQKEMEKGNAKFFFESDLVEKEALDKDGTPLKNEKGEVIKYRDLKEDFWETPKKSLIITSDQFKITPETK